MKTVFITGATSGIGKACAFAFAKKGARIILNGRKEELLSVIKEELEKNYNAEVLPLVFDVREKEEVFDAIYNIPDEWKKIDVLVNNAGLALGKDLFDDALLHDWETMIQTNITGLLYVTKAVLPYMKKLETGHIINLSSIASDMAYRGGNIYCATKSAVSTISSAMRTDLLRHKIKVTNVKPGAVDTNFATTRFKGDEEKADKTYDGYQPLYGEDVADIIVYCAYLPVNVCINDLTITPLAQSNGVYFYTEEKK